MKTIIAGSRGITDIRQVEAAVLKAKDFGIEVTSIVEGEARGVDRLAKEYGLANDMTVWKYPADWEKYGKRAGYIRNQEMARNAEALIAIWDGVSPGTANMIDIAQKAGLKVYVQIVRD